MRANRFRRWFRCVLPTVCCLCIGTAGGPAAGQPPADEPPKSAKPKVDPVGDQKLDQLINIARDELDLLKAQLEAKKALHRIGEARITQAKAWQDRYKVLLKDGRVTEERLLAAKDDVLMLEAHLAGEVADIKLAEMRVKQAQRRLDYGEFKQSPVEVRLGEIESRMTSMEMMLDRLQHEVGRLRREAPPDPQ